MSILSYVFDSEWSQRSDINSLKEQNSNVARHQRGQNRKLASRIDELEENVGELTLLCRSLLTALRENGTLVPAAFEDVMRRIDLEDGVLDGKVAEPKPPAPPRPSRPSRGRRR